MGVETVKAQKTAPPTELWLIIQSEFIAMHARNAELVAELAAEKMRAQRALAMPADHEGDDVEASGSAPRVKRSFAPTTMGSSSGGAIAGAMSYRTLHALHPGAAKSGRTVGQ